MALETFRSGKRGGYYFHVSGQDRFHQDYYLCTENHLVGRTQVCFLCSSEGCAHPRMFNDTLVQIKVANSDPHKKSPSMIATMQSIVGKH